MFELFGLIFGGVSRLTQHFMDLKEKQNERDHEARMFGLQVELMDKRIQAEADMRRMDAEISYDKNDTDALVAAIKAQLSDAKAAGGFWLAFSAAIRPLLTFWHAVVIYTGVKIAMFYIAYSGGTPWATALVNLYTDADRTLMFSMVSFWFADRGLRKLYAK
jgi:hypothetical protein